MVEVDEVDEAPCGNSPPVEAVGVDTGGTFTDVVAREQSGGLRVYKLLSTPDDPSLAIADGATALDPRTGPWASPIIHGTTVATNAILERKGAKIAFVTTAGFEDLLVLGRQNRPDLYALAIEKTRPLVEEEDCVGLVEGVGPDGTVRTPLTQEAIEACLQILESRAIVAVAICLLHSYANPEHEQRLARVIRQRHPQWHVSASHEIARVFREYERASTTTINAYVGPVMAGYLASLEARLPKRRVEILHSHGGRSDLAEAARLPVQTALSGPAGGVVGALAAARQAGIERIITFDMGGTSTDVSLCEGEPTMTTTAMMGDLPMAVPVIDVYTVGAGGGSIAYADSGGALKVGPRSAGAVPGPAAYGRGGEKPTVTDAHVVLGSLRPDRFLGGAMTLDEDASHRALDTLAHELGLGVRDLARGILEVADMAMSRAIKVISLERGRDPADYTLVAFGGAGGLHACRLAKTLGMKSVLIPRYPGALSAWGMLQAPWRRYYGTSLLRALDDLLDEGAVAQPLRQVVEEMAEQARLESAPQGEVERENDEGLLLEYTADLRYQGQSFELTVPVDWHPDRERWSDPREDFAREHERLYGYRAPERAVELVTLRLRATRGLESSNGRYVPLPVFREARGRASVGLGDGDQEAVIIERSSIADGEEVEGPAIVTEYSGTTVIEPGWTARNVAGHLLMQFIGGQENGGQR